MVQLFHNILEQCCVKNEIKMLIYSSKAPISPEMVKREVEEPVVKVKQENVSAVDSEVKDNNTVRKLKGNQQIKI